MAELNIKIYFVWYGKDFCKLDLRANMYNPTFRKSAKTDYPKKKCESQCIY
jgi:hypothetical protein